MWYFKFLSNFPGYPGSRQRRNASSSCGSQLRAAWQSRVQRGQYIIAENLCMVSFAVYCFFWVVPFKQTSYVHYFQGLHWLLISMYYFYVLFILWQVLQKQDTAKDDIHKISANKTLAENWESLGGGGWWFSGTSWFFHSFFLVFSWYLKYSFMKTRKRLWKNQFRKPRKNYEKQ